LLSPFGNYYRSARRPSRLTLGVAAATVAAVAGVSVGVSAGATHPAGAAGNLDAIRHAGAVRTADHAGATSRPTPAKQAPSKQAPSKQAQPKQAAPRTLPAHRSGHPPARVALVSRQRPAQQADGRHPARPAHQVAVRRPAPAPAAPAKPAAPYLIYDSVLPGAIPSSQITATYATGPYAATPSQVAGRQVMWIDVYGTDYEASALDVEPSDATPDQAASWVWHRLSLHPTAVAHVYTNVSEWPQVQAACATLPAWMQARIRWWIADPTGVPHVVPGSDATQWYWGQNYDISTATPRF
jgi:hypothetical protein